MARAMARPIPRDAPAKKLHLEWIREKSVRINAEQQILTGNYY
jgi:hypothetical protein